MSTELTHDPPRLPVTPERPTDSAGHPVRPEFSS